MLMAVRIWADMPHTIFVEVVAATVGGSNTIPGAHAPNWSAAITRAAYISSAIQLSDYSVTATKVALAATQSWKYS